MPGTARRLRIVGLTSIAAPLLMLTTDLLRTAGLVDVLAWSVGLWVSFLLFVPALLGVAERLRPVADRTGLTGVGLALVGLITGCTMQGLFRARFFAEERLDAATWAAVEPVLAEPALVLTTVVPGLFFPIGLLVLAFGLGRGRVAPAGVVAALAAGAVLFPVGRIGVQAWAVLASGALLSVAFGWLGRRALREAGDRAAAAALPAASPAVP